MTKCIKCQDFYGLEENNFECSKCCINPKIVPILPKGEDRIKSDSDIDKYLEEIGYSCFPDNVFKTIMTCISKMDIEQLTSLITILRNEDKKKYMFSDIQVAILSDKMFTGDYRICHFIVKHRLYPWKDYQNQVFHKSSYCYYGNYGEKPVYKSTIKRLLQNNMEMIIY